MIYLLQDTDCESPSIHAVLRGPSDFDFDAANTNYSKGTIVIPFIDWLCRYRGFKRIGYETVTVYNFEQPKPYRTPRKGTFDRTIHDMMKPAITAALEQKGAEIEHTMQIVKYLNSGKSVKFGFDTGVPR